MKAVFILNSRVPALVSWFFPVAAIALWPFVFVRKGYDTPRLIAHEAIHIKQYNELFVVGFLVLYLYDWVIGLRKYRSTQAAYKQIRFEQEARAGESDPEYPNTRERFAWRSFKV